MATTATTYYGGTVAPPESPEFNHASENINPDGSICFKVDTDNIISYGGDFADDIDMVYKTVGIGGSFKISPPDRLIACKYGWGSVEVTLTFENFNNGFYITTHECDDMTITVGNISNSNNGNVTLTLICRSHLENAINLYDYITITNGSSIVSSPTSPIKELYITSEDNNGSKESSKLGYSTSVSSNNEEYITITTSGKNTYANCNKVNNAGTPLYIQIRHISGDGRDVLGPYNLYKVTIEDIGIDGIKTETINRQKGELLSIKLSATNTSVSTHIGNTIDVGDPSNLKVTANYDPVRNVTRTLSYSNFTNGISVTTSNYNVVSIKFAGSSSSMTTPAPIGNELTLTNSNSQGSFTLTAEGNGTSTITIKHGSYIKTYTITITSDITTNVVISSGYTLSYSFDGDIDVDKSGTSMPTKVTGKAKGSGTLYVTATYNNKTTAPIDYCTVTVNQQSIIWPSLTRPRGTLKSISASGGTVSSNLTAFTGGTCKFTTPTTKATVTANYNTNTNSTGNVSQSVTGSLTLSSSDTSVISVDGTKLTSLKEGESTITVYNNGYTVTTEKIKIKNQSLTADVTELAGDSYSTSDSSYFTMAEENTNTIRPNVPMSYTITTKKSGTVYVKATYTYNGKTTSFNCQTVVITNPTVKTNNDALNNTGSTTITRTTGSITGVSIGSSITTSNVTVYCGGSTSYTPPTVKLNVSYGTGGNKTDCIKIEYGNFTDGISFDISGDSIRLGSAKADGTENPGGGYQYLSTKGAGKSTVSVKHNGTVIKTYSITVNDTTSTRDHTPDSTFITAESTDNSLTILNGNKVRATSLTGGTIKGTYTYASKSASATLFNVVVKNPTIGDIPTSFKRTKDTVNKIESISGGTINKISVFNGNTVTVNQPTHGILTVDYNLKNDSKTFSYSNFTDGITVTSSNTNYITTSCSNGICTLNCVGAPEGSDHTATPTAGTVTISVIHNNTIIKTVNVSVLNEKVHVEGVTLNGSVSYSQSGSFFTLDTSNNKFKVTGSNSELTTKTGSITATYNHMGAIYSNYKVCNVEIKQPNVTIPSSITRSQKPYSMTCDQNLGKINIYKGSTDYFNITNYPKIKSNVSNTSTNISYNSSEFGGGFSMSSDNGIISVSGSTLTTTGTSTGSANITIKNGNQNVATGKVNVYSPSLDYTVAPGDCDYYISGGTTGYVSANWDETSNKIALTGNTAGTNGKLYIKYNDNGSTLSGVSISDIITVLDVANVSDWGCDSNNKIYRPKNNVLERIYSINTKPSSKVGVFVGNSKEVSGLPSSIVLEYGNSNKSYNMIFTNFIDIPTVTSSNTEVIGNPDSEKITLTGVLMTIIGTGTTTITVEHQDDIFTKTIEVVNADNKSTVTSGWTYELANNIAEIK